jgi:hypothetical protein
MRQFVTARYACLWVTLLSVMGVAQTVVPTPVNNCDKPPDFYVKAQYTIAKVTIESPFDYLHSVRNNIQDALNSVQVKPGIVVQVKPGIKYSNELVSAGRSAIRNRLQKQAGELALPFTVDVVIAEIRDCNSASSPPSLTVSYLAFVSWFPVVFTSTFDTRAQNEQDPAAAARVRNRFRLVPQAGYNHSLQTYGGLQTSLETKKFGKFELQGIGSPSGGIVEASQSASFSWPESWIRTAEWRTGYRYYNVPSDPSVLKTARLTSQFSANSAPLGKAETVFRFGGSIGGGYDQSSTPAAVLPPGTPTSNPAGEIRAYAGVSLGTGAQSFKASYGVKFGGAQSATSLSFIKQLADVAFETRFYPVAPHKPIDLETHVTAGWITNDGAIPATERFFGGNYDYNFLLGDSWWIRSEPFIRSFPQNSLNRLSPTAPIGGQQFVSANATLAFTVWQRPLVPPEITGNKDFPVLLNAALVSAQNQMLAYWKTKDPSSVKLLDLAPGAGAAVSEAEKVVDNVVDDDDDFCNNALIVDLANAKQLQSSTTNVTERFSILVSLSTDAEMGSIAQLSGCVAKYRDQIGASTADAVLARLGNINSQLIADINNINTAQAQRKADQDMVFVKRTVHTLIDEMNFAAVSPVVIADAARIGPQTSDAGGGFRYGLGGGIRFTFVDSVRFTAGYAFNPNPEPWEGRGAAFFALEIFSLFQ